MENSQFTDTELKFYDKNGVEVDIRQFDKDTVVVCRILKEMTREEFSKFCVANVHGMQPFEDRGISVLFAPNWMEFTEFRER